MDQFPSNSIKGRVKAEEPKRVERITSGEAVRRKPSLGRRFRDVFIGGDAKTAAQYATENVVVPAIKQLISEALHSVIDGFFTGNTRPRRGSPPPGYGGYGNMPRIDYSHISTGQAPRPSQARTVSRTSRARQNFDDIVIPNRQEAEDVLDRLYDLLSGHGSASVADLYELTGIQSAHTDYKWGWTSLRGAKVERLRQGGYLLNLPDPEELG